MTGASRCFCYVPFMSRGTEINAEERAGALRPDMASLRLLVLAFVREYIERFHASPSYGEIAARLNTNRTKIKKAVRSLTADGLLLRVPGPRGLTLPTVRDECVRQLRELGWSVDTGVEVASLPVTKRTLFDTPALDYDPQRSGGQANGEQGDARS